MSYADAKSPPGGTIDHGSDRRHGRGIGAQIVAQLREELPLDVEILALGSNTIVAQKMMQARASHGASGENAIRISIGEADVILAPIGVAVPNSMPCSLVWLCWVLARRVA